MLLDNLYGLIGWGLPVSPLALVGNMMDNISGIVVAIGVAVISMSIINLIIIMEFKKDLTAKLDRVVALYRDERNLLVGEINLLREKLIIASEAIARLDAIVKKDMVM